jgi:hypothetical protein
VVSPARLLLDLDRIVRWVEPDRQNEPFTFWIAPATLVFDRAWNISGRVGPLRMVLEIADLHRLDPLDGGSDRLWPLEGQNFELRLRANGYVQYLRLPPRRVARQVLTMRQRGGINFAEHSFA